MRASGLLGDDIAMRHPLALAFLTALLMTGCSGDSETQPQPTYGNDAPLPGEQGRMYESFEDIAADITAGGIRCDKLQLDSRVVEYEFGGCSAYGSNRNHLYTLAIMVYATPELAGSWYQTFDLPMGEARKNNPNPHWIWGTNWSIKCSDEMICRTTQEILGGQLI